MTAEDFRALVYRAFGRDLENVTIDGVREFVAHIYESSEPREEDGRYVIGDETLETPESAVKRFLREALDADAEEARQQLWIALLDLWFSVLEADDADRMEELFRDLPPPE